MTLRKILIGIGLLIVFLPYLGLPQSVDTVILTIAGLLIVALLTLPRHGGKFFGGEKGKEVVEQRAPRPLRIEKVEITETPSARIVERTETRHLTPMVGTETVLEQKTTVVRRRRKNMDMNAPLAGDQH